MGIYPVLIILGGIVAIDTTAGPQLLISEPLVTCSFLGILFGSPEIGLMIGIMFQLLWLGYLPLGGTVFTDNNLAAFISAASYFVAADFFNLSGVSFKAALIPAMLFSVVIGYLGLHLHTYELRINGRRNDARLAQLEHGETPSLLMLHSAGMATAFTKGALMALIFIPAGALFCGIVSYLPSALSQGMSQASMIIIGTVAASAILFYSAKGKIKSLILGSIGGLTWILFTVMKKG